MNFKMYKKCAFTLAEVLITLVIIGVIAAITVPTLMAHQKKIELISQLKKSYSTLANGFKRVLVNDGVTKLEDTTLFSTISGPVQNESNLDAFFKEFSKAFQLSAIYNLTVGELRKRVDYKISAQNLLQEVVEVASISEIRNMGNYIQEVLKSADLIADDGITSMLQDVRRKRKTEVEIFSGEIINLTGEKIHLFPQKLFSLFFGDTIGEFILSAGNTIAYIPAGAIGIGEGTETFTFFYIFNKFIGICKLHIFVRIGHGRRGHKAEEHHYNQKYGNKAFFHVFQ